MLVATAMAQQTNTLDTLRQAFEKQQQVNLAQYSKAIDRSMAESKKTGNLNDVLILQAEQKRFELDITKPGTHTIELFMVEDGMRGTSPRSL